MKSKTSLVLSQLAIACSKLTETTERSVKFNKVKNKNTRTTPIASYWCLFC